MKAGFLRLRWILVVGVAASWGFPAVAQQTSGALPPPTLSTQVSPKNGTAGLESVAIAPGDIISVRVFDDQDLDEVHLRVTDAGTVPLLLLSEPVKVGGLTPGEASKLIATAYTEKDILLNAHVQVQIESFSSSDVTVIGSVNGISGTVTGVVFPVNAPRPLLTILALAGGFNERASRTVTIQRRDPNTSRITVKIPVDANKDLDNDPLVFPGDIVVVPRAGLVYVLGDVGHAQAVVMNEDGGVSLLQALTQAGSSLPTAGLRNVMIFRKTNGDYKALAINVGKIVSGKSPDIPLEPEDAIWVPFSYGKNLLVNAATITAAITSATATGIIYTH